MLVFISWSGDRSRHIAAALRQWLPDVLQEVEPWMSEEDISKGRRWNPELVSKLEQAQHGIVCLTRENVAAKWLNFEAGAIAKAVGEGRLWIYLHDLEPADFSGPLTDFQATEATRGDTLKLVRSINDCLERPLLTDQCERAFDRWWPELQSNLEWTPEAPDASEKPAEPRPLDDRVDEILLALRRLEGNAGRVEGRRETREGARRRLFLHVEGENRHLDEYVLNLPQADGVYGVEIMAKGKGQALLAVDIAGPLSAKIWERAHLHHVQLVTAAEAPFSLSQQRLF